MKYYLSLDTLLLGYYKSLFMPMLSHSVNSIHLLLVMIFLSFMVMDFHLKQLNSYLLPVAYVLKLYPSV